jgi:hypothetical protein
MRFLSKLLFINLSPPITKKEPVVKMTNVCVWGREVNVCNLGLRR